MQIELEEHTKADYDYQTTVASVLSVARRAKTIFESSEVHEKRAFLNYLLQNPVVKEKELVFSLKNPFNLVLDLASIESKKTSISTDRLTWLPLVSKFRTYNWKEIEMEIHYSGILNSPLFLQSSVVGSLN